MAAHCGKKEMSSTRQSAVAVWVLSDDDGSPGNLYCQLRLGSPIQDSYRPTVTETTVDANRRDAVLELISLGIDIRR
ncbi:hypothetical protein AWN90_19135 [Nocardia terpenica]|uniref:Uncharacterized protein n=1 Tax=Nocardia terpenica TaxID=455432 RepID=A0A161WQB6_9NOCA|nr:hypothetical protein AWN90_19135 [Nocardia terpenica]